VGETATYLRPAGLDGIEALHARYVAHRYRPHSHPTWTVAVVERGAAEFSLEATQQRARGGELFILEPDAVHTGMAAVPEGWAYKVLYVDPQLLPDWAESGGRAPRAAKWVVFRDHGLRERLLRAHAALAAADAAGGGAAPRPDAAGGGAAAGLAVDVPVAEAVAALAPHLRGGTSLRRGGPEHAAVRRAVAHLRERWDQPVPLAELAAVAGLSRFELVRRFSAQVGLPPHAFQRDLRIARARALLTAGEPPARVAADCGFADQPHFTRVFKSAVGVPPARYARATTFKTRAA
jgi:AraC-like DNA-binding protein